jgi:Clathrin light chain
MADPFDIEDDGASGPPLYADDNVDVEDVAEDDDPFNIPDGDDGNGVAADDADLDDPFAIQDSGSEPAAEQTPLEAAPADNPADIFGGDDVKDADVDAKYEDEPESTGPSPLDAWKLERQQVLQARSESEQQARQQAADDAQSAIDTFYSKRDEDLKRNMDANR